MKIISSGQRLCLEKSHLHLFCPVKCSSIMSTRSDFTTGDNMICMDQYHFGVSTEISQIYGTVIIVSICVLINVIFVCMYE